MSFTSPNHARALFWGLFATWLYAASVVWYAVITSHRLDPLSLGLGSISLGMLVYGTAVVHRAFAINALPFGATAFGLFGDPPAAVMAIVQIGSSAVLVLSSLVIAWVVYHAQESRRRLAAVCHWLSHWAYRFCCTSWGAACWGSISSTTSRLPSSGLPCARALVCCVAREERISSVGTRRPAAFQ